MKSDERLEIMSLLAKLSAEEKLRLVSFLRAQRGSEGNSMLPSSSQERGQK